MAIKTAIDLYFIYSFIRKLTTPFVKWDAYKLGIIDKNGRILRKRKTLDRKEKRSFSKYDLLILNLRKLLMAIPGSSAWLNRTTAALFLVKESHAAMENSNMLYESLDEDVTLMEEREIEKMAEKIVEKFMVSEEAPTNAAGGGQVAGIGVGEDGEPPVRGKMMRRYKRKNKKKKDSDKKD